MHEGRLNERGPVQAPDSSQLRESGDSNSLGLSATGSLGCSRRGLNPVEERSSLPPSARRWASRGSCSFEQLLESSVLAVIARARQVPA